MKCKRNKVFFFFQAEDGIRDLVRSRGLGDVYKRQLEGYENHPDAGTVNFESFDKFLGEGGTKEEWVATVSYTHLTLPTNREV